MFRNNVNGRITPRKAKQARCVSLENRGVIRVDFRDDTHDYYFNTTHNKRLLDDFGVPFVDDPEKGKVHK